MFRTLWFALALLLLANGEAYAHTVDVSAQVSVSRSGLVLNRATHTYNGVITLANTGAPLTGPLTIVLSTGNPTVILKNGATSGAYFSISVPLPVGGLLTGQFVRATLMFGNPGNVSFNPTINWITASAPGTLITQVIDNVIGGIITVNNSASPLNGTSVVVPPGALSGASDVIQIGLAPALPAPLDPAAIAAGVIVTSPVVELNSGSGQPFSQPVRITVPYNKNALPAPDIPVAFFWDSTLGRYMSFQTMSVDTANGRITYATIHFSENVLMGIAGLERALQSSKLPGLVESGFVPNVNGFRERNFSTRYGNNKGVCYGLTSFAMWLYDSTATRLYTLWNNSDPINASLSAKGIPDGRIEDDVARELINDTYTSACINLKTCNKHLNEELTPTETAASIIVGLQGASKGATKSPQLLYLSDGSSAHSVLAYKWDPNLPGFYVYDPNFPGHPLPIYWNSQGQQFKPYVDLRGSAYANIEFDSASSHMLDSVMQTEYNKAVNDWPSPFKHFNALAIIPPTLPVSANPSTGLNVYTLKSNSVTAFTAKWNPKPPLGNEPAVTPFAHIYLDAVESLPPQPLSIDAPQFTFNIPAVPAGSTSPSELVIIVANQNIGQQGQDEISFGYEGFLRARLVAQQNTTTTVVANPSTVPSPGGGPATLTATVKPAQSPPTGFPAPTGTVTFVDQNGITLCSGVALVSLSAACSASISLPPDLVTATYNGDANYTQSSGTATVGDSATGGGTYSRYSEVYITLQNIPCPGIASGSLTISGGGQTFSATASAIPCSVQGQAYTGGQIGPLHWNLKPSTTYIGTASSSGNADIYTTVVPEIDADALVGSTLAYAGFTYWYTYLSPGSGFPSTTFTFTTGSCPAYSYGYPLCQSSGP